jgi:hypothetical protein
MPLCHSIVAAIRNSQVPAFPRFQMDASVLSFEGTVTSCPHFLGARNCQVAARAGSTVLETHKPDCSG